MLTIKRSLCFVSCILLKSNLIMHIKMCDALLKDKQDTHYRARVTTRWGEMAHLKDTDGGKVAKSNKTKNK